MNLLGISISTVQDKPMIRELKTLFRAPAFPLLVQLADDLKPAASPADFIQLIEQSQPDPSSILKLFDATAEPWHFIVEQGAFYPTVFPRTRSKRAILDAYLASSTGKRIGLPKPEKTLIGYKMEKLVAYLVEVLQQNQ